MKPGSSPLRPVLLALLLLSLLRLLAGEQIRSELQPLVVGPESRFLEATEDALAMAAEGVCRFGDMLAFNLELRRKAEDLLRGRLRDENLAVAKGDLADEVAMKLVLRDLKILTCGSNLFANASRSMVRVDGELVHPESPQARPDRFRQVPGLEVREDRVNLPQFLRGDRLVVAAITTTELDTSQGPDQRKLKAIFAVEAWLDHAASWSRGRWESDAGELGKCVVSILLPRDKRELIINNHLFKYSVVETFGLQNCDCAFVPAPALKERYPLLTFLTDRKAADYIDALRRVAESGDAEAQCLLGFVYDRGEEGVQRNPKEAIKWWDKSGSQGFADALCSLGEAYLEGNGVAADEQKAMQLLTKAAAAGSAKALGLLGRIELRSGQRASGLEKLRQAVDRGDGGALLLLVKENAAKDNEAFLVSAAQRGHPEAMLRLGDALKSRDDVKGAWAWFYLAAKYNMGLSGHAYGPVKDQAAQRLIALRAVLTESALAEAIVAGREREANLAPAWMR